VTAWPDDRSYTHEHEWVLLVGNLARVGVTAHATEALGDIVYASLPTVGAHVSAGDACAELESTKSVSDVFAPVSGVIAALNDAIASAPETISASPFEDGWLFDIELDSDELPSGLLDAEAYDQFVGGLGG